MAPTNETNLKKKFLPQSLLADLYKNISSFVANEPENILLNFQKLYSSTS